MRVDPLEITQDVEVKRAGLKAVGAPVAQTFQVALGRLFFHVPDFDFPLHELTREIDVPGDKDCLCDPEIIDGELEELC